MGPRKEYLAIDSIDLDFCEDLVLGKNERKYSVFFPKWWWKNGDDLRYHGRK